MIYETAVDPFCNTYIVVRKQSLLVREIIVQERSCSRRIRKLRVRKLSFQPVHLVLPLTHQERQDFLASHTALFRTGTEHPLHLQRHAVADRLMNRPFRQKNPDTIESIIS